MRVLLEIDADELLLPRLLALVRERGGSVEVDEESALRIRIRILGACGDGDAELLKLLRQRLSRDP
jgi:hypothetical protein